MPNHSLIKILVGRHISEIRYSVLKDLSGSSSLSSALLIGSVGVTLGSLGTSHTDLALSRVLDDVLESAQQVGGVRQPTTVGPDTFELMLLNNGAVEFIPRNVGHLGADGPWPSEYSVGGVGRLALDDLRIHLLH